MLLQELLELGLFDLGDNDKAFQDLETAAEELAQQFRNSPADIIPAVLVALDADAPAQEPAFKWAKDAVTKHWPTFVSRFKDEPRQPLRMVLFDGLCRAASADARLGSILTLTSMGVLPYLSLRREAAPFHRELQRLTKEAETWACQFFGKAATPMALPEYPAIKLSKPKALDVSVDYRRIQAAVAPNADLEDSNPVLPSVNNPGNTAVWAEHLGSQLAGVISEAAAQGANLSTSQAIYLIEAVTKELERRLNGLVPLMQQVTQVNRRDDVRLSSLWWAEALYSTNMRTGYRPLAETSPVATVLLMAYDLDDLAAAPVPASVSYLLGETVRRLLGSVAEDRRPLVELVRALVPARPWLSEIAFPPDAEQGRLPLGAVLALVVNGTEPEEALTRTGLPPNAEMSLVELAMNCLRDLQALELASAKP